MKFKLSASALLVAATLLATTGAQASVQSTYETFSQLSPKAIDKLRVSNINVSSMLSNSSNDFIVHFDKEAFGKVDEGKNTTANRTYKLVKDAVLAELSEEVVLRDYYNSATSFVRVNNSADLVKLLNSQYVTAVVPNTTIKANLKQSLDFINQPEAARLEFQPAGSNNTSTFNGEGSVVAILDTGLNPNENDFGDCRWGLNSADCKVADVVEIANESWGSSDGKYDDGSFHGSNVSAVVGGVAPKAKLIGLDVFNWTTNPWTGERGHTASSANIQAGLNWVKNNHISNNANGYNFVSLNMSIGDGQEHQQESNTLPIIVELKDMGVASVAAAGNEEYTNGISWPATDRGVISVGAVFDTTDFNKTINCNRNAQRNAQADQVTCFSNSGNLLDLLAPGAFVNAGGRTMTGTSQASPHVAGAMAVLRAPAVLKATKDNWSNQNESIDATVSRLKDNGVNVSDYRNGLQRSRIDLLASVRSIARANPVNPIRRPPTGWKWYDCRFLGYCS